MLKDEGFEFFLRFLNERFDAFKRSFEELKEALGNDNVDYKITACTNTLQAIQSLKDAMSSKDHPMWIVQIEAAIKKFIARHAHYPDAWRPFINAIIVWAPHIASHKWEFSISHEDEPVDFDAYFQKFYKESRLPVLFDELVSHLQAIIESGEVDSVYAHKQLKKLINTVKRNASGSYFSVHATFEFAISLLKNLVLEYIGKIPGLGETLRAVQKTIEELEQEFVTVQQKTQDDIMDKLNTDLPVLRYAPRGILVLENTPSIDFNA